MGIANKEIYWAIRIDIKIGTREVGCVGVNQLKWLEFHVRYMRLTQ
jgi:hypothetical protein